MFLWPSSLLFLDRTFLSPVSGFLLLLLGFSVAIPRSFLSCAFAFLSSSRMLLVGQGSGALCLPPLCTFSYFVFFCLQRFFLLYRFPVLFLVLPLSLWFCSCSSPASSSSSMPCRRVLRVCLQFRLRLGRVILIPFPLLCLLPLKLLSGFHLFLPFLVMLFFYS